MGSRRSGSPATFLVTTVTNLVPLVGVFSLGWDPETLAVVYAVELLVAIPFAGVKALFAAQPPDYDELRRPKEDTRLKSDKQEDVSVGPSDLNRRRGSVTLVGWLPPVYPRNVSFATRWFGTLVTLTAVFFAVLGQSIDVVATLSEPAVGLSAASLVVSHVAVTERQYFHGGQYETTTPGGVFEAATGEALVVAAVFTVASGVAPTGALVVFVAVKLFAEWRGYRGERLTGTDREPGELLPVSTPETEPTAVIRPDPRTVRAAALWRAVESVLKFAPGFVFVWAALSRSSVESGFPVALACFGVGPAVVVGLKSVEYTLTHGTLTYQRRGETILAYDELTETPQWAVTVGEFQQVELRAGHLADRLYGARTFALRPIGAEYDNEISHVREYDRVVEAFELPSSMSNPSRLDRRVAGVTVGFAGCVVAAAGWVLSQAPSVSVFFVAFGAPLSVAVFGWMWSQGVPQVRVDME